MSQTPISPSLRADAPLTAAFLGPYAENDELLEKLVVEFLRDHVFWRRNFHPEDPPPIPTRARFTPEHQAFEARMRRELHRLSALLKRSVPFHSPRYIGHMASDLLLPGLVAQMITLPYNPNNVAEDAAPVTVELELAVGLMLARMLGFPDDPERPNCAFGHLTSGGSVANYEALAMLRSLRLWPVALAAGLKWTELAEELRLPGGTPLGDADDWMLANLSVTETIELRVAFDAALAAHPDPERARDLARAVEEERTGHLGAVEFHRRHPQFAAPVVLAPATAHYSWEKAMRLLGLGTQRLWRVAERGMRMDATALDATLQQAAEQRIPVLAVVAVLGTTEFGTLDPIHRIVAARQHWRDRGLAFGVHVDAAWGGYLASLFRAPDGAMLSHERVRADFERFPTREVYDAFAALSQVDSVTVDPHKLGYLPFGSGAVVYRDQRATAFIAQDADYVFQAGPTTDHRTRLRALGRFILEGSKPGANAAAAYVAHRVLPLDSENLGSIVRRTVQHAERFQARLARLAEEIEGVATLVVPFEPDSNLVCVALNPAGNRSLARANRYARAVYASLRVDATRPLQVKQFFASATTLALHNLGHAPMVELLVRLGIDPITLRESPQDPELESDGLFVLRHTLMNPWLVDSENGIDYLDLYCAHLAGLLRATSAPPSP